jgi:hypothetical protein
MATTMCMNTAPQDAFDALSSVEARLNSESPESLPERPAVSWEVPGGSHFSLRSLYALAQTITLGEIELTPIQAWFELAGRYPLEILLSPTVAERMRREFVGVVRCTEVGATMEREAFESVVGRVMEEEIPKLAPSPTAIAV